MLLRILLYRKDIRNVSLCLCLSLTKKNVKRYEITQRVIRSLDGNRNWNLFKKRFSFER